jgi:hypothetical protein
MDFSRFDTSYRKAVGAELYIRSWLPELSNRQNFQNCDGFPLGHGHGNAGKDT